MNAPDTIRQRSHQTCPNCGATLTTHVTFSQDGPALILTACDDCGPIGSVETKRIPFGVEIAGEGVEL